MSKAKEAGAGAEAEREEGFSGRIHGSIARALGIAIVSGQHQPGDVLNNEIDASEKLHVSRSAYREAIRILAAKGLVESRPKTGTWSVRVTAGACWTPRSWPGFSNRSRARRSCRSSTNYG